MSGEKIIIAYCDENENAAKEIASNLRGSGFSFDLVACGEKSGRENLKQKIGITDHKVLLLISDNFLKSIKCMEGGLSYLQKIINSGQTLPVIIDGQYPNAARNGMMSVPTKFERVSSVIKYMNFWQDEYLELRKQKKSISADEEEVYSDNLKTVRSISSEIGEVLRFMRESYYCDYDAFKASKHLLFFQKFSTEDNYKNFAANTADIVAEPITTPSIAPVQGTTLEANAISDEVPSSNIPQEVMVETNPEEPILDTAEPKLAAVIEDDQVDSLVEEILEEEGVNQKVVEEANNTTIPDDSIDTELLAQELALNLPDTGISVSQTESSPVDTALEDLSSQRTEENEKIMQNGLEMLGVGATTAAATGIGKNLSENKNIVERQDTEMKESDLLRTSHEMIQNGKIEQGLNLLQTNLEAKNNWIAARYQYAVFLAQYTNNFKEASKQLEEILTNDPKNLPANFFLGELSEAQGNFLSAKNYYEKVEAINPNFPNLHHKLGMLLSRRYKNKSEAAAIYLEKAFENNPGDIDALYQLGVVQSENLSLPNEAIGNFEKVLALQPNHPFVNYDLALVYFRSGERAKALKQYNIACEINPELKTPDNDLAFALSEPSKEIVETEIITEEIAEETTPLEEETLNEESAILAGASAAILSAGVMTEEELELENFLSNESLEEMNPDYTLEVVEEITPTVEEEEQVVPLSTLVKEEIAEESITNDLNEEALEAEFDAEIGALGAAGLGIAAGAKVNGVDHDLVGKLEVVDLPEETIPSTITELETEIKVDPPTGKVVMITGATSGIGKATAELFAEHGYDLVLTGRRFSRLFKLKEELEAKHTGKIRLLPFDVTSAAAVTSAIKELDDAWKNIDILINNAGLALGFEPIHEGDLEDWDTMIDTNVKGLLYMTRAVAPYMVKNRKGHIINISSIAGKEVYPNGGVYCATKHAVEALTKAMRIDLHKHNIRVSQIAPGHVEETEFAKVRFHGDEERAKIYEDFVPVNSRDIADSIYFLATRPAHVNIQDIFIMGTQQASATITDRSGR